MRYTRFEQANGELAKVDKEFDQEFSRMLDERKGQRSPPTSGRTRAISPCLPQELPQSGNGLRRSRGGFEREVGCLHKLIEEVTTATSSTSIGTGDRGENETEYLQDAHAALNEVLADKDREGHFEIGFWGFDEWEMFSAEVKEVWSRR